ncbi:hypothetical protein LCGC14_0478450 [marine sediment metagenome]|uniref:Uncharacterized protein n=1 Tax=marine sediment metagenome TaxID=412755 RepID=A0A0F9UWY0_9ZZZZ
MFRGEMNEWMMKLYYLHLTSWVGISLGAAHTYADIEYHNDDPDSDEHIIIRDHDNLFSDKEAIAWGRKWINKQRRKEPCALLLGNFIYCDPQLVLAGPRKYKTAANRLYREAEDIGYWDYNERAMKDICRRWDKLNKDWNCT